MTTIDITTDPRAAEYIESCRKWLPAIRELAAMDEPPFDCEYARLFKEMMPRITEAGLRYETIRMWRTAKSISENGYTGKWPIRMSESNGVLRIADGWHRSKVLLAMGLPIPVENCRARNTPPSC